MKRLISIFIASLLIFSGCSKENEATKDQGTSHKRLHIITTFYPMYYFAKQVAGDAAQVDLLIPNGVEPHDWEPTAKDLIKIQNADVFVYNSHYFEKWTDQVLKSIDRSKLKVVEASKGIELIHSSTEEEGEHNKDSGSSKDPHVWLSPILAQQEVSNIAGALSKKDPKNQDKYASNADSFNKRLNELNQLYKDKTSKAHNKVFVTQHAAFGYIAKQYGLTQIPIAGLSPDVEPSMAKLQELAKTLKDKKVKVIYFEGLTSPRVAQTLANEIGAKTEVLNPLEGLTKEEQKKGLDYIDVMKNNLTSLERSLMSE